MPPKSKIINIHSEVGSQWVDVKVGVYFSHSEFLTEAAKLYHPFDGSSSVPDDLLKVAFEHLVNGIEAVSLKRAAAFQKYRDLALELQSDEEALHRTLRPERQRIMKDKKALLFKRMCADAGVEDEDLHRELLAGISLVGEAKCSPLFVAKSRPAKMTVQQVMSGAKWQQRAAMAGTCQSKDAALDEEIWAETKDEVAQGFLQGPFTQAELSARLGPLYVISKRFGIRQGERCRPIDDLAASLVNSCFGAASHLDLGGVDEYVILARAILEAVHDDRCVVFTLSDGSELRGFLHESWTVESARTLSGRTLDLQNAYKQLLVALPSLWAR